ncbi:hypothetical protein [Solimonas terrae]|uniref:Transferrin-binding protein-like solute binding protein n=1 Tax=Solimonas terrae TaxID=1396819 RepID=A0A6M2BR07_9GAMM|nr:hypothetical protein [Solimonas terrae]NGY04479.1 hypothetical protein [Solimonas terrae]
MNKLANRSHGAVRTTAFALTLITTAALSACGNDNNDNGGGGSGSGDVGAADLSAAGTQQQVGTFGTLVQALGALDALSNSPSGVAATGRPLAKQARIHAKAGDACPGGGTSEDSGPTSKNVGSPFTSQPLPVSTTSFHNCRYVDSQEQDGNSTDVEITLDGSAEGGALEGGDPYVEYFRIGDDSGPYSLDYHFAQSSSGQGVNVSSDVTLELGIRFRDDYKSDSSGSEDRFVLSFDGSYDASATSNGQGGSTSGDFTYYIGKSGAPFTASDDSSGTTISGEYGFKLSGPAGASCPSGGVTISTLDPLTDSNGAASPFSAGRLQFSSGGSSSQVTFNDDGTVTVQGSDGQSSTFSYAEAVASAGPCAGYALAGLYLAAGAAPR